MAWLLFGVDAFSLVLLYVAPLYAVFEMSFDRPVDILFIIECALSVVVSVSMGVASDRWLRPRMGGSSALPARVLLQVMVYIVQVIVVFGAVKLLSA